MEKTTTQAPFITDVDLENMIIGEAYYVFPDTTVTICSLRLRCGFSVIGTSASLTHTSANGTYGRYLAREHAKRRLWELEGYRIKRNRGVTE